MNADEVLAAIAEQFPELAELNARLLGEGTDNHAFLVGERYVFRFPKRDDVAIALAREVALLPRLAPHLPLSIPEYRFIGRSPSGPPRLFAGYEKLPGAIGSERALSASATLSLGRELGSFLRALHVCGKSMESEVAVGTEMEEWGEHAVADLALVADQIDGSLVTECTALLASPPPAWNGPSTLVHGDFAAEHVLLDDALRPTGVIDWTDMSWSDPAIDVSGLLHWGGREMASAAMETYAIGDPDLLSRAAWFARCRALADLAFGRAHGRREYVEAGKRALILLRGA